VYLIYIDNTDDSSILLSEFEMFIELRKINLDFIAQKQEFSYGFTDTSLRIDYFYDDEENFGFVQNKFRLEKRILFPDRK